MGASCERGSLEIGAVGAVILLDRADKMPCLFL